MINLEAMVIDGFNKFVEKQTITFNPEIYYILGNNLDSSIKSPSNGAGKSSILNAICWCLFGRTVNSNRPKEVIGNQVSRVQVTCKFDNGLQVVRTHDTKHDLKFYMPGEKGESGDVIKIQEKLNTLLGVNWRTFQSTCCMFAKSTASQFLEAAPAQRIEILGDLVDDKIFQQAAVQMITDFNYYQKQRETLEANKNILIQQYDSKYLQLQQFQTEYTKAQAEEANRKTIIEMKIAQTENKIKELISDISYPPNQSVESIQANISTLMDSYKKEYDKLKYLEFTSHQEESVVDGAICKTCKRYIDASAVKHYHMVLEESVEERKVLTNSIKEIQANLEHQKEFYHKTLNWWSDKKQKEDKIQELKVDILDLKESMGQNTLAYLNKRKEEMTKELTVMFQTIQDIDQQIYSFSYYENILKYMIPGFRNEIKNILFDQIRGDLEHSTGLFLNEIADNMCQIHYPSKNMQYKEKFEILMESEGQLRDISTYSPGEKWRASFACLLALRHCMMIKTQSKLNFLLIDDPLGELDKGGCEELFKILNRIHTQEKNLILVTMPEPKIPYDANVINVVRSNYVSRISY